MILKIVKDNEVNFLKINSKNYIKKSKTLKYKILDYNIILNFKDDSSIKNFLKLIKKHDNIKINIKNFNIFFDDLDFYIENFEKISPDEFKEFSLKNLKKELDFLNDFKNFTYYGQFLLTEDYHEKIVMDLVLTIINEFDSLNEILKENYLNNNFFNDFKEIYKFIENNLITIKLFDDLYDNYYDFS